MSVPETEWLGVVHAMVHGAKGQEDGENCELACSSNAAGKKMRLSTVIISVASLCSH